MTSIPITVIEDRATTAMRSLRAFGDHTDGTWPIPTGGHTLDWHKGYVAALHGLIHHATGMTYRTIALRLNQRILEATE